MRCATRSIPNCADWNNPMLLSIQDLQVAFRIGKVDGVDAARRGRGARPQRRQLRRARRTPPWRSSASRARARASPRCRSSTCCPTTPSARPHRLSQGRDLLKASLPRAAGAARARDRLRLPGPDEFAATRCSLVRPASASRCSATWGWAGAGAASAPRRCWSRWQLPEPQRRLSSYPHETVGRAAAARDDRDGAGLRARSC